MTDHQAWMREYYRMQRLHLTEDLGENIYIETTRDQGHYLAHVLRMAEGGELLVFNGRDGEWLANISRIAKKTVQLHIGQQVRQQSQGNDIVYCFAPIKQGRLDYLIQKAAEMGAGMLQPVMTQHTQISRVSVERLQANVIEAAEQCGILSVPEVMQPVKLERLLADWDQERVLIFCDEDAQVNNPLQALQSLKADKCAAGERGALKLGLLIGPEGGFSTAERTLLRSLPFVTPILLGPRILRADTAGVAALALIQATIGDWSGTQ